MTDAIVIGVALVIFFGAFLTLVPLVFLANKAIGATFEREAERMKADLAGRELRYSEDGVKLRMSAFAPFALRVTWMWADLRVDGSALYVMRYALLFGKIRFGQPNLRMTWVKEPAVGGFTGVGIVGRPTLDGDAVVVSTEIGVSAVTLRLRPRNPHALLSAIDAMR